MIKNYLKYHFASCAFEKRCVPLAASTEASAVFIYVHVVCELKLIINLIHIFIQDLTSE